MINKYWRVKCTVKKDNPDVRSTPTLCDDKIIYVATSAAAMMLFLVQPDNWFQGLPAEIIKELWKHNFDKNELTRTTKGVTYDFWEISHQEEELRTRPDNTTFRMAPHSVLSGMSGDFYFEVTAEECDECQVCKANKTDTDPSYGRHVVDRDSLTIADEQPKIHGSDSMAVRLVGKCKHCGMPCSVEVEIDQSDFKFSKQEIVHA